MSDIIHQCLHGYKQGHHLLACSTTLSTTEAQLLGRLSDISGPIPRDTIVPPYLSGYPCGRYYALAKTWVDYEASRRGSVLTHTLLISLSTLTALQSLASLFPYFRPPASAEDMQAYLSPLKWQPSAPLNSPTVHLPSLEALTQLYFTHRDRPILWVEALSGSTDKIETMPSMEAMLSHFWTLLWPEWRQSFSFCTLALSPRGLLGKPFTFLRLPPEAQGEFFAHKGKSSWHYQSASPEASIRRGHGPDLFSALHQSLKQNNHIYEPVRQELLKAGLPIKDTEVQQLTSAQRFMDLAEAATQRLPAARGRADLLEKLWPTLPYNHPAWINALAHLLKLQNEAALQPKPFWELFHLFSRPQTTLQAPSSALRKEMQRALNTQVGPRLIQCTSEMVHQLWPLLDLFAESIDHDLRSSMIDSIAVALHSQSPSLAPDLVKQVLDAYLDRHLFKEAMDILSSTLDSSLLTHCDKSIAQSHSIHWNDLLHTRGVQNRNPMLIFWSFKRMGKELNGLVEAAALYVEGEKETAISPSLLWNVLDICKPKTCLTWALLTTNSELQDLAIDRGEKAAIAAAITALDLATLCSKSTTGTFIFAAATQHFNPQEVHNALRPNPALAWHLLTEAYLREEHLDEEYLDAVIQAVEPLDTNRATLLSEFAHSPHRNQEVSTRLHSHIVDKLVEGGLPASLSAEWIQYSPWQEWLAAQKEKALRNRLANPDALTHILGAYLNASQEGPPVNTSQLRLLHLCLLETSRASFRQNFQGVSQLIFNRAQRNELLLYADLLWLIRRHNVDDASQLVAKLFPPVYSAILRSDRRLKKAQLQGEPWGWDKAKPMRKWLLDNWANKSWPEETFIICLSQNHELANDVIKRGLQKTGRRKYLACIAKEQLQGKGVTPGLRDLFKSFLGF